MNIMKINIFTIIILTTVIWTLFQDKMLQQDKFMIIKTQRKRKNLEKSPVYFKLMKIMKTQHFEKILLRMLTRKRMNKLTHIKEGNKRGEYLQVGWWNDKSAQKHLI